MAVIRENLIHRAFARPLLLLTALLLAGGCARPDRLYQDPADEPANQDLTADGLTVLPSGFFNQSVNRAVVDLNKDSANHSDGVAIRLRLDSPANPIGAYNGSGIGNTAMLGVSSYSGVKLSDLGSIGFDGKIIIGDEQISVLLIADLLCDGSNLRTLRAEQNSLASGAVASATPGYLRINADFNGAHWTASGAAIMDPIVPATTLVPAAPGPGVSLAALIAAYPNVCVRNALATADELPRGLPTAGILLTLGSPQSLETAVYHIKRVTIGATIYDSADWGD